MQSITPALIVRKPDPAVLERAKGAGMHPVVSRVLAQRIKTDRDPSRLISPLLRDVDSPATLPDIDKAARRIAMGVLTNEHLLCSTDFDVDGTASSYVFLTALGTFFGHPQDRMGFMIGHRLKDGHGLTNTVAERILQLDPQPSLVITADHGSSDEARIALLARHSIDTIVTDHHAIPPEGPPRSAYAVVTPARSDSTFPDRSICGAMVAFYLMNRVRSVLIEHGHMGGNIPPLSPLLPAVAAATVADCVDLRSINNRAVISYGLKLINQGSTPAWRVFRKHACRGDEEVTAETLAFQMGPRVNASSRVADAASAVHFFMSSTDREAEFWWSKLDEFNEERKVLQKQMQQFALEATWPQVQANRLSIVYYGAERFSPGVHGIVASRLVEAYGRPTFLFSPVEDRDDLITGSARSIDGCDIKKALDHIAKSKPDLEFTYGGHSKAAGARVLLKDFNAFSQAFEEAVSAQISSHDVGPRIYSDGKLPTNLISLDTVSALDALEPFGREFDRPSFHGTFCIRLAKAMGDGSHLMLDLEKDGQLYRAVWFSAITPDDLLPVSIGDSVNVLYQLRANHYQGRTSLQLMVQHLQPLA